MGKKSRRTKTAPATCEVFGCDCKLFYNCETCKKRVCAAHFLGTDGCVCYDECSPIGVCARCPFCKKVNELLAPNNEPSKNKLKKSLNEFTVSNGNMEFSLEALAHTQDDTHSIGKVTLEHRPCPDGCCAGKLRFCLESRFAM